MDNFILANRTLVIVLFALGIGLAFALVAWLISRALSEVPDEAREFKDVPPLGFRLLWWPIQWMAHYIETILSGKQYTTIMTKLRQAGLDYTLNPAQFIAGRLMGVFIAGCVAWWIVGTFDKTASFGWGVYLQALFVGGLLGWAYPAIWLRERLLQRKRELLRSLPFYLDIITLCVEAGLNIQGALIQSVAKGPKGVLQDEFQRVLRDIRAGKSRADALRSMALRLNEPTATHFTTAVIQAESMGMNLGPVLRAQADQRRVERFLRAEKLAMEAPVKMLFPLIAFIFPCTFIVLFFPIAIQFMHSGF